MVKMVPNLLSPLLGKGYQLAGSGILPGLVCFLLICDANSHCSNFHADGSVNPPRYYYSHEEIEAACHAAGVEPPPWYTAPENMVTPAQFAHNINVALGATPGMQTFPLIEMIFNIW